MKQEMVNMMLKQPCNEDFDMDIFSGSAEDFSIDDIYKFQERRVKKQLDTITPSLKRRGNKSALDSKVQPVLTTLVNDTYVRMAKELAWLEQKTNIYENPAEKRLEELRNICILNNINNPIIGEELYDPRKPDTTRQHNTFS